MPTITVHPPELHHGQRAVWDHPARFQVLATGRRWGKSRLGALHCVWDGAHGKRAWWVAPSFPMASIGWRMIKRLANQLPGVSVREVERIVTFPGGGWVQVRSADNPDSLRGEGLDFLVVDECAFVKEDAWTEALRPALADRKGGAYLISTPKGRNWFWRAWTRGQDEGEEWHSWQLPTASNPYIDAGEIEAARGMLPERVFEQEFLAQFLDDAGGVFRRVMDAATATEAAAQPGEGYVIGVDWGKHNDFTVLTVLTTDGQQVAIDRFNQIDYMIQLGRLRALADRYQPAAIVAESNSMGEPLIEQMQRDGLPVVAFQTTNATKTAAIDALALAFEQGTIRILPDPVLISELQAYEMERLPSGLLRYSAPDGMHDDCVMSLALAWQGVAEAGPLLLW